MALVIASLGLLTLVALQAASLRYTRVAERRAVGSLLAGDLLERLRANTSAPAQMAGYAYSASFSAQAAQAPPPPTPTCAQAAATCTQAQMAEFDLYQWRQAVRVQLPEGAVLSKFSQDPADASRAWLDLWVAWRDPVLHQAAGVAVRAAGECPDELQLDSASDATVRCLRWRVYR